jgi:ATP-dependent Clp protease protease subunit
MTNNTWYNMTAAEGETSAEISIYDAIGSFDVNAKQFVDELKEINADTINLRINSPGGSVIDGNAMFNALQRHPAKVITHIDGLAASMASVIAMAGDEVHMADNALLMIHNPWTFSMGDADELRKDADLLDKMSASILSSYGRSQYEADELKNLMDEETWFTAQEALDAGFIDHISTGLRAAASDITAMAAGAEIKVPAEKQVVSLTKQIDAISKASVEISADLLEQVVINQALEAKVEEITTELASAALTMEAAEASFEQVSAELEAKAAEAETKAAELEAKDAEIEQTKEITEEAVAAKAAELVQVTAHAPVADLGDEASNKISSDEFWAEYKRVGDEQGLDAKNVWYAENKHRKS